MAFPCTAIPTPSITKRTVVTMAPESVPGCVRTKEFEQVVLYENFNPLAMEAETVQLNRARNGLGPTGFAVGLTNYRITGSIYIQGSGYSNVGANWTRIFEAAGFKTNNGTIETRYVPDTGAPDLTVGTGGADITLTDDVAGQATRAAGEGMLQGTYLYKLSITTGTAESQLADPPAPGPGVTITDNDDADGGVTVLWTGNTACIAADYVNIYRTYEALNPAYIATEFYLVARVANPGTTTTYLDTSHDGELTDKMPSEHASRLDSVWYPWNSAHKSLTIRSYLDSNRYVAGGVRGTISFSAESGQPMKGDFDLLGVYTDPDVGVANIALAADPGIPPRLEDIACTLFWSGGSLTPTGAGDGALIIKSIGLDLGVTVTPRRNANNTTGIIEYGIFQEVAPRVNMQVEVSNTAPYDFMTHYRNGRDYRIEFTISPSGAGSDTGQSFKFICGGGAGDGTDEAGFNCTLATPPTFDDADGVRVWNLEFVPNGADITDAAVEVDNYIKVRQF